MRINDLRNKNCGLGLGAEGQQAVKYFSTHGIAGQIILFNDTEIEIEGCRHLHLLRWVDRFAASKKALGNQNHAKSANHLLTNEENKSSSPPYWLAGNMKPAFSGADNELQK